MPSSQVRGVLQFQIRTQVVLLCQAVREDGQGESAEAMEEDPPAEIPQAGQAEPQNGEAGNHREDDEGGKPNEQALDPQPGTGNAASIAATPPANHKLRPSVAQADGGMYPVDPPFPSFARLPITSYISPNAHTDIAWSSSKDHISLHHTTTPSSNPASGCKPITISNHDNTKV